MTRTDWLQQLIKGDLVAVHVGSSCIEVVPVTSASRTMVTIGQYAKKANFRRKDGKLTGRKPMGHLFHLEMP